MKGLLIKDFKLLKVQKNFFLSIIAVSIGMVIFSNDVTFVIGFLTFVVSLFTLSTISYDEFDNGNVFLFTLPITRVGYVVEKYVLGIFIGLSSLFLSTSIAMVANIFKQITSSSEIMITAFSLLPIMLLIQALMIPFHLKYGGEKGRIALIGAFGIVFIIGIILVKLLEKLGINVYVIISNLPTMGTGGLILVLLLIASILLLISLKISTVIMKKKEF